ncbi:ABC transporter-like protein [Delitschia confertaspora ATCC 74209]|uniref:ABC transporter-like protein n=1 Tax=Delitschia confertaspora ATCC 74209 TaxID=1513339 RepID=A0A9P4JJ15_9PLEO|nr:ABC transporter-like protein [Delitschia confertaspora ATCC 74209]
MANSSTLNGLCTNDYTIGPVVRGCHNNFDFTLFFEEIALSVVPCSLLLLCIPFRFCQLRRSQVKTRRTAFLLSKVLSISVLAVLQLSQLVLYAIDVGKFASIMPSAASVAFATTLALLFLSYFEHRRTSRPSSLITTFLIVSILFDIARVRSIWLRSVSSTTSRITLVILISKASVLLLELREKRRDLKPPFIKAPPEATANLPNRAVFWWINPLLVRGTKAILSVGDLWETDGQLLSSRLYNSFQSKWRKGFVRKKYSLLTIILRSVFLPLLYAILPRLLLAGFQYSQPVLINRVIDVVEEDRKPAEGNVRLGLIGATALIYLGIAVTNSLYKHSVYRTITMVRGILVSIIFEKSLNLSLLESDGRDAITLANTDVDRICNGLQNMHEIWANVVEIGLAVYLLQLQVGIACIVPVILGTVCTFAAMFASARISKNQSQWNQAVQRRVSAITTTLNSIKNIKFSAMSDSRQQELHSLRVEEIEISKKYRMMNTLTNVISNTPAVLSPVVAFTIAASSPSTGNISVSKVFAALSIINLLCSTVGSLLGAIPAFFSTLGCFQRIQEFLELGECKRFDAQRESLTKFETEKNLPLKHLSSDVNQTYQRLHISAPAKNVPIIQVTHADVSGHIGDEPVLQELSVQILAGSLTVVMGPVASGKSFFLRALLGETHISRGSIKLSSSTMAYCPQNPWLPTRTIRSTITGESNIDQKWYDITVDACALTEDFSQFPDGDGTIIKGGGANLSGGQKQRIALCRALYAKKELLILDDVFTGLDGPSGRRVFDRVFGTNGLCRKSHQTVILATHSVHFASFADTVLIFDAGKITKQGKPSELLLDDSRLEIFPEEDRDNGAFNSGTPSVATRPFISNPVRTVDQADFTRRTGDTTIYAYYFKHIGWADGITFTIMSCLYVFLEKFPQIWLQWWAEDSLGVDQDVFIGVYFLLGILCLSMIGTTIGYFFVYIVPRFVLKFHSSLLQTVMRAPLLFLTSSESGSILNRFSQDIQLVDMSLPPATFITAFNILFCLSEVVLICLGAKYIAAIIPLGLIFAYCVQKFYLLTSRQLRYLEIEAKAPLYAAFIDTIQTLETIRAFGWQTSLRAQFFDLLDMSQRPYYLLYCIQRWLNVVLDLFVAALAVILVTFSVELRDSATAGAVGVALVNVLAFNENIAGLIVAWTNLETSLGAIARLRQFEKDTPTELLEGAKDQSIGRTWPSGGAIEFTNVTAAYSETSSPVLRDVSFSIKPGQHVCICGRTGSGKSTLLQLLLFLLPPPSGSIMIDGVLLSTISPTLLRSRIIAVSQDSIQPISTLRMHLDPDAQHSTAAILCVLTRFDLAARFSNLDEDISSTTLSAGQAQLMSLVRAVLRRRACAEQKSGVLLLDEATSALDKETERMVIGVIREKFQSWTVLSIVHREYLVKEFDAIIRVEDGRVVMSEA